MEELLSLADPGALRLWQGLTLGYTETLGHPLLREEIASLYEQVSPQEIICFAGAEEAIYTAMRVLLRPGDHMVVTFPGYQSLYQVAEAIGAQVSRLYLKPGVVDGEAGWNLDLEELHGMMRPHTRLVVVNFPHNPTGALPGHRDWLELVDIARRSGCYLFSDEVYRLLEYRQDDRLPAAVTEYEKALSLGVMSKPFGLAGLRVGWIASRDRALLGELAAYKDYTTICNSAPSEILAIIALRSRHVVLERSMALLRANLARVENFMQRHRRWFEWIPPRAGSIAFPKWLGPASVDSFCEGLVQSEGVLLLPASVYDYPESHFRLGMGRENLLAALERLESYLEKA